MRIAFLGLGLIGGSVALDLRAADPQRTRWSLTAWSPAGRGPASALAAGVLDEAAGSAEAAVAGADLIVLAAPPMACAALVGRLGDRADLGAALGPQATITDVASTKGALTAAALAAGIPFVGGHPMAGREASGFGAAVAGLFRERPWVITESVGGGDAGLVRTVAGACGATPVELPADLHDRLVASISHLPLVTSVALVEAVAGSGPSPDPDWPSAARLAATGWRDTTRLARGDTTMGAEIAASNAAAIVELLRRYRTRIDAWIEELEAPGGPDTGVLRERLDVARARLEGDD